ncbi:MAG: AraC family transcriptional regulator [Lachnospiraceae bacterium]|jgi:AraC-like DNA-binding protein|nr:hypothetical protein C819_00642 [Lachnospiraceae bacterium 10-1]MCX4352100.1 AraC family transcriptional regulator [Lachnospiraceae bacterium]
MGKKTVTEQVLSYIESNLDKELTLEKIAKELNYSKFYLARQFKRNIGVTLHKYIQSRRLTEAAGKLAESGKPIIEIAFEAGYGSQQAFTKAFCKEFMCTPQKYRKIGKVVQRRNKTGMNLNRIEKSNLYLFVEGRAAA